MRWLPRVFLAAGIALLVAAAVAFVLKLRFVAEAERATGTVVDMSRSVDSEGTVLFQPIVRFTTPAGQEIEFVSPVASSPPSADVGDRVEVLYDADDPHDAELSGFFNLWLVPFVFGFLGVVFSSLALFGLLLMHRRSKADVAWLRANGVRMQGRSPRGVESVVSVAGRSPFHVEVDVHDPLRNEVRVLTSEDIWFDPAPYLEGREFVDVYVDPNRPKRYYVDVSFLPQLADS